MANDKQQDPFPFSFMISVVVGAIVLNSVVSTHASHQFAMGLACTFTTLLCAAKLRWELRTKWWFWTALIVAATLQLPAAFYLPWNRPYLTGAGGFALAIPGFLLTCGLVALAEKVSKRAI